MARGEHLRKLLLTHQRGDDQGFRSVALELIAEEQRKSNNKLAKDLLRIIENDSLARGFATGANGLQGLPKDSEKHTLLVDVRDATRSFDDIVLKPDTQQTLLRVIAECQRAELLRTHGFVAKSKLLFCGPPGCGKTLCAEVVAQALSLPLLYTRFDAVVSSYLGETAANLRKVFDYAAGGQWVVFFDEFDAIGKARDDPNEHGELKRVINTFLQLLDGFGSKSLVIAATNHEHLLDPALWRRFDEVIDFPLPTVVAIRHLLRMKLRNFPRSGINVKTEASRLKGMAHADVERVCFDAIKTAILEDRDAVDKEAFDRAVKRHKARLQVRRKAASHGET